MKKSTIITIIVFLFVNFLGADESSFETLSKLKDRGMCENAMNHMMDLLENDPDMKKMGPEIIKKMKDGFEKEKDKRLDECVKKFNQKEVDCILNSDSFDEVKKKCLKGSKKSQCENAMNHIMGLLENDSDMKKMGPEIMKKMKDGFEKEKDKRLGECVEKFDQEEVDCIMSLKSLKDAGKCNINKNTSSKNTSSINSGNNYSIYEKELQCNSAMNHMMGLLENDPDMKKMGPEIMRKMKDGFEKEKDKRLQECVKEFKKDEIDCIMSLKSLKDAGKCNLKK